MKRTALISAAVMSALLLPTFTGADETPEKEKSAYFCEWDPDQQVHIDEAIQFMKRNMTDKAIPKLNEVLALPNMKPCQLAITLDFLGMMQEERVDYAGAIRTYQKSLAQNGLSPAYTQSIKDKIELLEDRLNPPVVEYAERIHVVPAKIPKSFLKYGSDGACDAYFDVDDAGVPENINIFYCSDRSLKKNSKKAIKKWRYAPKDTSPAHHRRERIRSRVVYKVR